MVIATYFDTQIEMSVHIFIRLQFTPFSHNSHRNRRLCNSIASVGTNWGLTKFRFQRESEREESCSYGH